MEYGLQDQGQINIDLAARERMASFRFRFGSSPINPSSNANSNPPSPLTTGTNFNIPTASLDTSPIVISTRTPMAPTKTHGRSSSHSRSHSQSGSLPTPFTFPLRPSTMNNVPSLPSVNINGTISTRQSPPTLTSNIEPTYDTSQITPSPLPLAPPPRSRPGSHHKRRSSVSTRRESAELMGISLPPECPISTGAVPDSDTIIDGRRMALWALEGKGTTSRRPDFIGGYTKVEIPELNETTLNLGDADENEPPTRSSSKVNGFGFNHNSFPPLGSSSSGKRDSLPAFTFGGGSSSMSASSGKRDSLPSFGLGCATGGNKRDSFPSFNNGFGLGMGLSSANKRDSFGKFLNTCLPSDQLGTLVEEEEDVEDDVPIDELEDLGVEEDEEEEGEEGDETFRADTHEIDDDEEEEEYVEHQDNAEGDILQDMDLDEEPLPHAHLHPQIHLLPKSSAPAPMSTSTPISPPISVPIPTDISTSRVTAASTAPVVGSTHTPTTALPSTRPRPANLNLNLHHLNLRPLSLTPDSLPLNTRAASISGSSSFNDSPSSNTGSAAYTPSPRVPGLRKLSLVAAASFPAGSVSTQSPLTREMRLKSSSSSNTSGSISSISYRRSPLSIESESGSSEVHSSRPNHQYATLRRTSQSHLPTPGATPTSAIPPSLSPFGMTRENCEEEEEDCIETMGQTCTEMEKNGAQAEGGEDVDGDASTPTGPALTVNTTKSGSQANLSELDRPLSPTEQAFFFRSHTSLLCRISELEDIISQKTLENRDRSRNRGLSSGSDASSSYGRRHGRFESGASSVSTNTSLDTTTSPSTSSPSEPSDELLQLITDLKSERDSLMHDLQTYQSRISELEKTITTLTRRVEAERRESWVAQERMSVLEIERRRAAEEVSKLENVVKGLRDEVADFERVKTALTQEKERISALESHVEAVRSELDNEKAGARQVEDEASLLRKQVERMTAEMDALRALVAEQHAQILQFQQMQMQTQAKRVASNKNYNGSHNSFASTSASDSLSFSNAHSHMSSSSTLAVDADVEAEAGDEVGQYKYVPVGMSPPHSHATRATLGSVAEAEEDTVIPDHRHHHLADDDDVPRDITTDESEDDEDDVTAEDEDELAHYEDADEYDEDEEGQLDDDEVVWGEDVTTSSFGDFVPKKARSAHGHDRIGSMEKGWSFAAARANAAQAQSLPMLDLTPTSRARNLSRGITTESKKPKLPKVDRFFECLDALEDEDEDNSLTAKIEFSDAKSLWSSAVRQHDEDDDEMDLPPFLLPATAGSSSASDSTSPSSLNVISEEDEDDDDDESSTHLATPAPTPSWKDLLAASLDAVAEEDEDDLDDEEEDDCPPSPSLRPTLVRNARVQSLLPQSTSTSVSTLLPPATAVLPMTPNTLKTTLDATVRSPQPARTNSNRWNTVGASLGLGFPSNKPMTTTTPVKTRSTFSSSTPVNGHLLPTPPPTLIPRLSFKSGLSPPASPMSPSPAPSVSPVPSSVPSPISNEFVDRERGISTPTIVVSKYRTQSPSRIPTPSKKNLPMEKRGTIRSGFIPAITASAATVGTATSSATVKSHFVVHEISHVPYSASHQGEGPGSGSRAGLDSNSDHKSTLVAHCKTGKVDGASVSSRSRLRLDVDTRSLRTPAALPIDLQSSSSNSNASPTFGGFAARLKTFWKRGGSGDEDDLSRPLLSSSPRGYTSPINRRPAYVSRVKQVEALRMRLEKESQGCRTQDEVIRFIGCSQCADPTIIRPSSSQHHAQQQLQQNQQQPLSHQRASGSGRSDTGAWPCLLDGCNKVFAREADLKRHQRTTKSHSIPGSVVANPCPLCEATFTRSDAMRRHLKSRHQGKTPETLNLGGDTSNNGPSSSNISSGGSSSRGGARRAYSPSEETSELSASDSEQQPYHQQTSPIQQPYTSSSRNPVTTSSSNYYSSPSITSATAGAGAGGVGSSSSSNSGMHQNASHNMSHPSLYQPAVSYEIQHALSSPRQSASSPPHHHSSTQSSSSSRRDVSSPTHSHFPMHSQQAVTMPMSNHQPAHSSYHQPYTTVQDQYPTYHHHHQPYPGFTSSSGYTSPGVAGTSTGNNSNMYANPYRTGPGYMVNSSNGVPWKAEDGGGIDDGRGGGIPPSRQSGGLATLAMHASRIRPMSPLSPGKAKSSTKSELENALGPQGVYRR
ncbi:hypothetical protein Clacol_001904 [Clathrus columnatus]|uniref:C2H2-type domain-containing protein n=1 Tax=Clathrus columnatus TaxID=1419009 RepID=A0AAV5A355_9AGAM|nr:hypothetical protein Clacol_001904 [Clathrus columnatus]